MHTYLAGLILYGIVAIVVASWGMGLNTACTASESAGSVRKGAHTLLVTASVVTTLAVCSALCDTYCGGSSMPHWVVPVSGAVLSGTMVVAGGAVHAGLNKCKDDHEEHVKTYQEVLLYTGIIPGVVLLLISLYLLWTRAAALNSTKTPEKGKVAPVTDPVLRARQKVARDLHNRWERAKSDQRQIIDTSAENPEAVLRASQALRKLEDEGPNAMDPALSRLASGGLDGPLGRPLPRPRQTLGDAVDDMGW